MGLSIGLHALYYGMEMSLDLIGNNVAKNCFFVGIADFFGYGLSGNYLFIYSIIK